MIFILFQKMNKIKLNKLENGLPGISANWGKFLAEAGAFCLDNSGHKSGIELEIDTNDKTTIEWTNEITTQIRRSWNDPREATEFGATSIAILLALENTDYTIIERSMIGTGFDYSLGTVENELIFKKTARLEISGILSGKMSTIKNRVKKKIKQTTLSDNSGLPAYIAVIEFSKPFAKFHKK